MFSFFYTDSRIPLNQILCFSGLLWPFYLSAMLSLALLHLRCNLQLLIIAGNHLCSTHFLPVVIASTMFRASAGRTYTLASFCHAVGLASAHAQSRLHDLDCYGFFLLGGGWGVISENSLDIQYPRSCILMSLRGVIFGGN